jgi:hypothetical protein
MGGAKSARWPYDFVVPLGDRPVDALKREGPDRGWFGWLGDLVRQVFSDQELISPGRYCAYNAFAGVVLVAAAVLMQLEPRFGSPRMALPIGLVALVLLSAIPVAWGRPRAVPKLLILHGALFVLLGLAFAAESVRWAFFAPAPSPFRYAPGLSLAGLTYGALQVAGFGDWAKPRRLRIAGLTAGVICEIVLAVALLIRAFGA